MKRRQLLVIAVAVVSGALVAFKTPASQGFAIESSNALSAQELESLVVSPPAPFVKVPDSVHKTGLMEFGNPRSGVIGIGFASSEDIKVAGFQRGWERIYATPDGAVFDINLFEFKGSAGPVGLVDRFVAALPSTYQKAPLRNSASIIATGTSPEGRAVAATAIARGRFFVVMDVGGPPKLRDYAALLAKLATKEIRNLRREPTVMNSHDS